ncbi:two component transcriptional regulator, winged helix family [Bacteroides coprosuis DSM 18011]|uniref:Two component transcriptional regulator, winged helix family n=1 Tax=Bacteroides coprosuis DSM 18011 TaxID=679937 RepID=F3ZU07_9BACE|nr:MULTISPECIES: response regulator transcription factor [Bacteroides]EGJ71108.1 two component transcriptional regulator, winged helix family [Bacteroides coprosuis DSM 18011]HJD91316.1 response regulator transcription factor [Bacteroides coprosuis]
MNRFHILVVDDEEDLCDILQFNLEDAGYSVDAANSAEEALAMDLSKYDLFLLDVMMGEISGYRLASMLREQKETEKTPIIFLTAKDTENDMVAGFNAGADDYISKPFSLREVLIRIKAVLKRTNEGGKVKSTAKLVYNTLVIDLEQKKVTIDGEDISLTKREFEILQLLLEQKDRVFSRQEILDKVWVNEEDISDRTVDVNITRIRKKIGHYDKNLVTRLGYGYCFETK